MIRLAILSRLLHGLDSANRFMIEPLLRLEPALRDRGVCFDAEQPDGVLVDVDPPAGFTTSQPVVLLDRTDGATLWWYGTSQIHLARSWLRSPQVKGVIKVSRYTNTRLYNQPWAGAALHLHKIYETSPATFPDILPTQVPEVTEGDLRKIVLGYGYWAFAECDRLAEAEIDLDAPRALDVFCAACVEYESPMIARHRQQAMEAIQQLRNCRTITGWGRHLSHPTYCDLMRQARICVSPWGWGEMCIRDYEAMLAGCVLVKPRTDFIESEPCMDERHYVPCAVDFSDLQEKVDYILLHWFEYWPMRTENRRRLLALRRPDALADRLAALLRQMFERE
jgi:hypothetical protein